MQVYNVTLNYMVGQTIQVEATDESNAVDKAQQQLKLQFKDSREEDLIELYEVENIEELDAKDYV